MSQASLSQRLKKVSHASGAIKTTLVGASSQSGGRDLGLGTARDLGVFMMELGCLRPRESAEDKLQGSPSPF